MVKADLTDRLCELLEPVAEDKGFELVAVEQSGGRGMPVIRVLLDRDGGLNIDDICEANAWVGELLEEQDPISGPYTLEVSSPGIDRPLRKLTDFDRFAGETATVKARETGGAARSTTGTLAGTDGDVVLFDVDGQTVQIPYPTIIKARIKGVVDFNSERGAC